MNERNTIVHVICHAGDIVSIHCRDMDGLTLSGRDFARYYKQSSELPYDFIVRHGITNEFLHDKGYFDNIAANEFKEYIRGSCIVYSKYHNPVTSIASAILPDYHIDPVLTWGVSYIDDLMPEVFDVSLNEFWNLSPDIYMSLMRYELMRSKVKGVSNNLVEVVT